MAQRELEEVIAKEVPLPDGQNGYSLTDVISTETLLSTLSAEEQAAFQLAIAAQVDIELIPEEVFLSEEYFQKVLSRIKKKAQFQIDVPFDPSTSEKLIREVFLEVASRIREDDVYRAKRGYTDQEPTYYHVHPRLFIPILKKIIVDRQALINPDFYKKVDVRRREEVEIDTTEISLETLWWWTFSLAK